MTYYDMKKNKRLHSSLGFFIEHKKRMAERLSAIIISNAVLKGILT
jgi:hypothetical protein